MYLTNIEQIVKGLATLIQLKNVIIPKNASHDELKEIKFQIEQQKKRDLMIIANYWNKQLNFVENKLNKQ